MLPCGNMGKPEMNVHAAREDQKEGHPRNTRKTRDRATGGHFLVPLSRVPRALDFARAEVSPAITPLSGGGSASRSQAPAWEWAVDGSCRRVLEAGASGTASRNRPGPSEVEGSFATIGWSPAAVKMATPRGGVA